MMRRSGHAARTALIAALLSALLGACARSLLPEPAASPTLFALSGESEASAATAGPVAPTRTLIVDLPRATPGFESSQIAYVRRPYEIEYFAHNQWVDTPSNMLAPQMVRAIGGTGAFHAVLGTPTSAVGQFRLETEIVRLQQDFSTTPSHVRLTLRAALIDTATRKVVASREFDARVDAPTEDPYGGVIAAQRAASQVMAELALFCAASVR
ncbi:cholesterol transport system auxiliary component [Variovorax sp. HW608]|uniref:ABC-type transport auxiliary lipoprotein family protein n=1 Tax=Variovorax sp. HW608 TaxID=1034889 RepID=UPI00081F83A6|nr:ABC-type transport auxiliary lipoprotein family protein [Variovorax sp. HW608]SCK58162.1 cholesterol transport system auxiliary component [Variovorax sp. HW608]